MTTLALQEINSFVDLNQGWHYIDNSIQKKFKFQSQSKAFQFIIKVAQMAEEISHHPEWSGKTNTVFIKLYSHDSNCITKKDIEFAVKIEELAK